MRNFLKASAAMGVLAVMTTPVLAQDDDVIVVTSSPIELGTDEVVSSVEVVNRRHIEENLSGSLADTIAHEPGVTSTYFGPAASRPVIRGLGADRVRVLVNGTGLVDASAASPDHAVTSEALEADSVEILRGPAAIAYGGGAIGGVVNVIDGRIPEERAEDGFEGRFYAGVTTVDEGETAAGRVRFNAGDLVFQFEGVTRNAQDFDIPGFAESEIFRLFEEAEEHDDDHDDDDDDHDEDHEEEEAFGTVENSGLQFDMASGGVSYVGDWGFIGVGVKRTEALYGIPGGHHHHEEEHDDDDHDDAEAFGRLGMEDDDHDEHGEEEGGVRIDLEQTRYDIRGEFNQLGDTFEALRFAFGAGDYTHTELEGDEIGTVFTNEGYEARVELRQSTMTWGNGTLDGAFGLQTLDRDFSAVGAEAFVPPSETSDWGLFIVERWETGDWGVEGGLRFENRDISTATISRSFDTTSFSGSIFTRPNDDSFLALTLSSTERAPTDVELFADGPHLATQTFEVGDPTLDAETALSAEVTARTMWSGWTFEASVYRADFDGFIGEFPTGAEEDELPVFQFQQVDAVVSGFETRMEGPIGDFGGFQLSGELVTEFVDGEVDGGGNLPQMPPFSATGGLTADAGMHEFHAELVWADVQDNTAAFEYKTGGYLLTNVRYSVEPFEGRDLRLILEGRNLTDEEARLHTSVLKDTVPLPGRNFRAALVMSF